MHQVILDQSRTSGFRDEISINSQGSYAASYAGYQLYTAYQPIVQLDDYCNDRVFGCEGLVRCKKDKSYLSPPEFFRDVDPQDRLHVEKLCHELHIKNWRNQNDPNRVLFINLDVQLLDAKPIDSKKIALAVSKAQLWGVDPDLLVCEVIESKARSLKTLKYLADCLKDFGVRIAVDDFGVDYSNIERVRLLKPDFVKLDGLFFHRFATNGRLLPMLQGLVSRLQDMGSDVIAEAVETEHHRDTALDCGISLMQGYFFGRPEIVA